MSVVVTTIGRPNKAVLAGFDDLGVATLHEAQGRKGLPASYMCPIYRPIHMAGSAVWRASGQTPGITANNFIDEARL